MGLVNVIVGYLVVAAIVVALTEIASDRLTTAPLTDDGGTNQHPDPDE